jgi:hypothetical protein
VSVRAPEPGVHAYVGKGQQGKTTLAFAEFLAFCREYRCGGIVVDAASANNFRHLPHVATLAEAVRRASARDVAYWTPGTQDEVDVLFLAIEANAKAPGERMRLALFLDEVSHWRKSEPMQRCLLTWAHKGLTVFATAQQFTKHLGESFMAVGPHVRLFNLAAPLSLRLLSASYRIPWDDVEKLRVGEFILVRLGEKPLAAKRARP